MVEGETSGEGFAVIEEVRPEPKRRGRPPKNQGTPEAARSSSEEGTVEVGLEDHVVQPIQEPPKRRGRAPGTVLTRAKPEDVAQAAPLLVALTNNVAVAWMGPECAMLPQEVGVLTPSVARMLARLPRSAAQAVSAYTDPFVVLVALGLWARRIQTIKTAQARADYAPPSEMARANGQSGTVHRVPDTLSDESPVIPLRPEHPGEDNLRYVDTVGAIMHSATAV